MGLQRAAERAEMVPVVQVMVLVIRMVREVEAEHREFHSIWGEGI